MIRNRILFFVFKILIFVFKILLVLSVLIFLVLSVLIFFFYTDFTSSLKLVPIELKYDTLFNFVGNLFIAMYIASVIAKKQKNVELKIDNCFKELDSLLDLLKELRNFVIANNTDNLEDNLIRYLALISLQIQLVKKYNFIIQSSKDKLDEQYYELNTYLTEEVNEINQEYKYSLLQLEKTILNIKSNIL